MKNSHFIILLFALIATSALAQKRELGILLPAKLGEFSHVIPIDKKYVNNRLKKENSIYSHNLNSPTGIIDTLINDFNDSFFEFQVGDTGAIYFNPPAVCQIKSIGLFVNPSGNRLADGFYMKVTKSNWHVTNTPKDSVDKTGWAGFWDESGCWSSSSWGFSPIGEMLIGEFHIPVGDGSWIWTDFCYIGPLELYKEFIIVVTPYGDPGESIEFLAGNPGNDVDKRLWRYYHEGITGPDYIHYGWFIQHLALAAYVVVEFMDETGPFISLADTFKTVLTSDPRIIECHILDIPMSPFDKGVVSAWLCFKVNADVYDSTDMNLSSGCNFDGTWQGIIPGEILEPGDSLTFYFSTLDMDGNYRLSLTNSYKYFGKQNPILFFYNDDCYPANMIAEHYMHLCEKDDIPYHYDIWDGLNDGALSDKLVDMYDNIIQIDGASPVTINDDIMGNWFRRGTETNPKHLFWSSQDWAFKFFSTTDPTNWIFPTDDWHSKYLGISQVTQQDINYPNPGEKASFQINPVTDDIISGKLADFIVDSLQLYYDPYYESGFCSWIDAIMEAPGAVVCFTDSAQGRTVGVHKETPTSKSVFLTFDQLALNTGPKHYWTEYEIYSVLDAALDWFNAPITAINEKIQPATPTDFNLAQNYPNPFNSETVIRFKITKPAKVNLSIYNVRGQKVTELINKFLQPGIYHFRWNVAKVVSGVYFYKLEAGEFTKIKKMVLMR